MQQDMIDNKPVKEKEGLDKKDKKYVLKRKKRTCAFCTKGAAPISYKDDKMLRRFISERGKILPRRVTGTCQKHQRELVVAIKRARHVAILPYVIE